MPAPLLCVDGRYCLQSRPLALKLTVGWPSQAAKAEGLLLTIITLEGINYR